eukprot:TRINITY_DN1150_c4_g2_i1.p1 TRINITY_DN1150_c4_g2~~TRINITY_DN1150_c4_g2_i1.p1  ORF type:complete len:252 (+),score=87.71 TRINITY_DN1150_c4_g2_i1:177-932(+)
MEPAAAARRIQSLWRGVSTRMQVTAIALSRGAREREEAAAAEAQELEYLLAHNQYYAVHGAAATVQRFARSAAARKEAAVRRERESLRRAAELGAASRQEAEHAAALLQRALAARSRLRPATSPKPVRVLQRVLRTLPDPMAWGASPQTDELVQSETPRRRGLEAAEEDARRQHALALRHRTATLAAAAGNYGLLAACLLPTHGPRAALPAKPWIGAKAAVDARRVRSPSPCARDVLAARPQRQRLPKLGV